MDERTAALRHAQNKTTGQLLAAVRPYAAVKSSMDEWDAGMASAQMRENEISLGQVVTLVRSLSSRIEAASSRLAMDGMTRRSIRRHADELRAALADLDHAAQEPAQPTLQAAE